MAVSANKCALWAAIAYGALLQGRTALDVVEGYLARARDAIKEVYDDAAPEVLRAYLLLAIFHATQADYPRRVVGASPGAGFGLA